MSSIKFSQLQPLTSPPSDTVFPAVSSGSNYKITLSAIKTAVTPSWSDVTGKPTFNSVAFSGLYADLGGKPTIPVIPTLVSAFTNDRGYLTSVDYGTITNAPQLSAVATSGNWLDIVNKPAWFSTTATGYLYSDGSGVLSFQPVIDVTGGISVATVTALIANSLTNFTSGATTATVNALIANSLSNFVSGVSTATVNALIANSLTNLTSGGVSTATVNTLIANSLTNNLATVARSGNWNDVVNKPAWFMTTATGYLYSDGTGTLNFQPDSSLIQSATTPVGNTSTLWYDTVGGRSYVYYDSAWVDASPMPVVDTTQLTNNGYSLSLDSAGIVNLPTFAGSPSIAIVQTASAGISLNVNGTYFNFNQNGSLTWPDTSVQTGSSISVTDLKTLVAASTSFEDFQARIAAL